MKASFWHQRWESGQLGFHQEKVNALLSKYWPRLGLASDDAVFVPLCGKSLDMGWIRDRGHPIIGVELSPIAIKGFFEAASLSYSEEDHGLLRRFSNSGYELYCGDLFDLEAADIASVRAVYDRASLIALPPETRARYASKLIAALPDRAKILLVTVKYDQCKMGGPPHSVPPAELESLFGNDFEIEELETNPPSEPAPRFKQRGLDVWQERVQLLTRRDQSAQ